METISREELDALGHRDGCRYVRGRVIDGSMELEKEGHIENVCVDMEVGVCDAHPLSK